MSIDKSWPGYNKGIKPDDGFEWAWQEAIPADLPDRDPAIAYISFGHEKKVLPKGWKTSCGTILNSSNNGSTGDQYTN
ncbi:hypothetical protein RBB50_009859 [Rhinocladiella similis]